MTRFRTIALGAAFASLVLDTTPARAQRTADSAVRELAQRQKALQRQIDQLNSARDSALRERLMQRSWREMQDYLGWMRDRWDVGYAWMMGYRGRGCCATTGGGAGAAWPLPQGTSPTAYWQQMHGHMQSMHQQMTRITQAPDSAERHRLLQEHWQTMYQNMQAMRGMGWMWAGPMRRGMMWRPMPGVGAAKPLPEPDSRGATLVTTYCTQCHAAPSPTLHTSGEWEGVTSRMKVHMGSGLPGIKVPTDEDMRLILAYMQRHAR